MDVSTIQEIVLDRTISFSHRIILKDSRGCILGEMKVKTEEEMDVLSTIYKKIINEKEGKDVQ